MMPWSSYNMPPGCFTSDLDDDRPAECHDCGGAGYFARELHTPNGGYLDYEQECETCEGTGRIE